MTFSRIFKPRHNYLLERIGKENDGGYLINPNAILKSNYLLSIGIFDDWSFEKNFITYNRSAKVLCYDDLISFSFIFIRSIKKIVLDLFRFKFKNIFKNLYLTIDYALISNKIKFHKKNIYKEDLLKIITNFENVFLKIDIEGSEYSVLEDIIKIQNKLTALIIEFHDVDINRKIIENFISKFELELTHIHPNNYGRLDQNNDPTLIELSFERYPKICEGEIKFPNNMDQNNNPKKKEITIRFSEI